VLEGPALAHGRADAGTAHRKVRIRVLALGVTVIALVLAETIYIGRTTAPMPALNPANGHHKRVMDPTFTLMPPHAAPRRHAPPPARPVLGMIEAAAHV
jgi:hypothetical protein